MKKVSVIMPAYNAEKYIENSILSILNQTYKNLELIIINDGSQDNTEKIIKNLMKTDERIVYFKIKNSGSAVARNIGLENATGYFIAFVDADDYIDSNMYETLIKVSKRYNCDIVSSSFELIYPDQKKSAPVHISGGFYNRKDLIHSIYPKLFSNKKLEAGIPTSMWTKIYKRSLIENNNIRFVPELKMSQDTIFTTKCLLYTNSFYYLPELECYKYVQNKSSRTHTYLKNGWKILRANYGQLQIMSEEFPDSYKLEEQLPYAILRNAMSAISNVGRRKDSKKYLWLKEIAEIVNDNELQLSLKYISVSDLPIERKILYMFIKNKKINMIYFALKVKNISII